MNNDRFSLISVIIPTYNVSSFIECTLWSVLSQTYNNLEIIIIDDGSEDDTCKKIESLSSDKIRLFRKKHTGNVGKNLNEGIEIARGEYIAILGSDDYWDKNKLEKQVRYINKYKLICSNGIKVDGLGNVITERFFDNISSDFEIDICQLLETNYVISSSVLGEKKIFQKYGGFEQELGIRGEDYYLWLNIASSHNIIFINETLVYYRIHRKNLTSVSIKEKINVMENSNNLRERFLTSNNENIRNSAKKGIITVLAEVCKLNYYEGYNEEAAHASKKLIRIYTHKFTFTFFKILLFFIVVNIKKLLQGGFRSKS